MIKTHGFGCKKCIVHWGYYLLPVRLRLGSGITKIGV